MLKAGAVGYPCSLCPAVILYPGAHATHENACKRKLARKREREELHAAEAGLRAQDELSVTHDREGRII